MEFTYDEIKRLSEFANWLIEKKDVKDSAFCSASIKLNELVKDKAESYIVTKISPKDLKVTTNSFDFQYLDYLSSSTRDFVIETVNSGGTNPYHSIMATLNNRYKYQKDGFSCEKEFAFYIERKQIPEEYLSYYEELFKYCFERFLYKNHLKG